MKKENVENPLIAEEEKQSRIEANGRLLGRKIKSLAGIGEEDLDANNMQKLAVKLSYFTKFLDKLAIVFIKYTYAKSPDDAVLLAESLKQLRADMSTDVSTLKDSEYRKLYFRNMNTFRTCAEMLGKADFWDLVRKTKKAAVGTNENSHLSKLANITDQRANKSKE